MIRRWIPIVILPCRCLVAAATYAGFILGISTGAQANASPTAPPGVTLSPGANLTTAISGHSAGTQFNLQCGTYRFPTDNRNYNALNPLAGDIFLGQNADLSYPAIPSTAVPASPPCVHLNGSIVIPTNSPDNAWHTRLESGNTVWYNQVGSANAQSSPSSFGRCNDGSRACQYDQDLFWTR
jgi:hypothetical protein